MPPGSQCAGPKRRKYEKQRKLRKSFVSRDVSQGTALLADFKELALFLRGSIRIDAATQGNPTGAEYDLFGLNAFVIRREIPLIAIISRTRGQ
jgi:hypothetical protein